MTKKPYHLFLYLSFMPLFFAAACSKNVNYLYITPPDPDSGFTVRNWYILPQENYSKVVTDSLTDSDYQTFKELSKSGNFIPVHQEEDYSTGQAAYVHHYKETPERKRLDGGRYWQVQLALSPMAGRLL